MSTLLLFGATGMVGAEVLDLALADPRVDRVISVGRRRAGVSHVKLEEIVHADFMDLAPLDASLERADACIHCLGVYTGQVPDEEFWKITYGYIDALVTALERVKPSVRFVLMGAAGADPTEKRPFIFAKAKGRAEKRLTTSRLADHFIFRPGYIDPYRIASRASMPTWITRPLYWLLPFLGIGARDLARVMLESALTGKGSRLLENKDIRKEASAS